MSTSCCKNPVVLCEKDPFNCVVNCDALCDVILPLMALRLTYENMQAALARVTATKSKRAASSSSPGDDFLCGPGKISSSKPGMNTTFADNPFDPCIVIIRTFCGSAWISDVGN